MMRPISVAALMLASNLAAAAQAQTPDPMDIRACTALENDAQRLTCYDHATGREHLPTAQKKIEPSAPQGVVFGHEPAKSDTETASSPEQKAVSLLDSRWELSPDSKLGTFNVRAYKPITVMPFFASSNQNDQPSSPNPSNTVEKPQDLDNIDSKFQLSLKTKVWQGVFGDQGDLWVAYTQSSRWQVYNEENSRPFRETNYEPEAILVFNTNYEVAGWNGRLLGIALNHE